MSKRDAGRVHRTNQIKIILSDQERGFLRRIVDVTGINASDFLRQQIRSVHSTLRGTHTTTSAIVIKKPRVVLKKTARRAKRRAR